MSNLLNVADAPIHYCDPGGARTLDPLIKSQLLYQLSYGVLWLSEVASGWLCRPWKAATSVATNHLRFATAKVHTFFNMSKKNGKKTLFFCIFYH